MEIKKAIEWLKAISATQSNSLNKSSIADRKEALHLAIVSLEKQIPKKPQKREVGSEKLKRIIYHCPNCGKRLYDCAFKNGELDHVSPGNRKSKRCEKCDYRLDWSDFNG